MQGIGLQRNIASAVRVHCLIYTAVFQEYISSITLYLKKIQTGSRGTEYLFEVIRARSVLSFARPERGRDAYHMQCVFSLISGTIR